MLTGGRNKVLCLRDTSQNHPRGFCLLKNVLHTCTPLANFVQPSLTPHMFPPSDPPSLLTLNRCSVSQRDSISKPPCRRLCRPGSPRWFALVEPHPQCLDFSDVYEAGSIVLITDSDNVMWLPS